MSMKNKCTFEVGDIVKFSEIKFYEPYKDSRGLITKVVKADNNYYYTVLWFDDQQVYDGYARNELVKVS